MDLHCTNCAEPWDLHHVHHDAWMEACPGLEEMDAVNAAIRDRTRKLDMSIRRARLDGLSTLRDLLALGGWKFGSGFGDVRSCPACMGKPTKLTDDQQHRVDTIRELAEVFGEDADGFACMVEDIDCADAWEVE